MLKKILIGGLTTLVVGAVGVSAYNTNLKPTLVQAESQIVAAAADGSTIADPLLVNADTAVQAELAANWQYFPESGSGRPAAAARRCERPGQPHCQRSASGSCLQRPGCESGPGRRRRTGPG